MSQEPLLDSYGSQTRIQSSKTTSFKSSVTFKSIGDDDKINFADNSSAGIMNVYKKLRFGDHESFYSAKSVMAEGITFCNDSFYALTGAGGKIMRHDLIKGGDPEMIYDSQEEYEKFTFEYLKNDKLIIIESTRVYVVDLNKGNKVIAEITADQLGVEQIYGYSYDQLIYQGHLIDDQRSFIMKLPSKIQKLDLTNIDKGQMIKSHSYWMDNENHRFFHSHYNEETRSLFVNSVEGYKGNINAIFEISLDTLDLKRKIGPGIQGQYFYFAEKYKKIFSKNQDLSELRVQGLSRNLQKEINVLRLDDVQGFCLAYPERNLFFTAGKENIRVYDIESHCELSRLAFRGDVKFLRLSPDKSKLLISTQIKEGEDTSTEFYVFDLEPVRRVLHDLNGRINAINRYNSPSSDVVHIVHEDKAKKLTLRAFEFEFKELSDSIHDFTDEDGYIKGIVVDSKQQYCYVVTHKDVARPPKLHKITLKTGERICSKDFGGAFKDKGPIKDYGILELEIIRMQNKELLFINQSAKKEDRKQIRVILTLSCDDLELVSSNSFEQNKYLRFNSSGYEASQGKKFAFEQRSVYMVDLEDPKTKMMKSKIELEEIAKFSHSPCSIELSSDQKFISVGLTDGSVNVFLSKYFYEKELYKYARYRAHEYSVISQKYIGNHNNYRLATLDLTGKVCIFCLKEKTVLVENKPLKEAQYGSGSLHYNVNKGILFITQQQELAPAEEITLKIDLSLMEDHINSNLQENINKRFLQESDSRILQNMVKFVKSDDRYLANKLNLFTMATFWGNYRVSKLLGNGFQYQTTLEGDTLIQHSLKSGDINSFDVCLYKIADSGEVYFNQVTLGQIISSQPQETLNKFLNDIMITEAEFNDQALGSMPLKGDIKNRYIVSDEKLLTPMDLKGVVKEQSDYNEQSQRVDIFTLCSKVTLSLGNQDCLTLLEHYEQASDAHLQVDKTGLYIEALWSFNWRMVFFYSMINIAQFFILAGTVVLAPTSQLMFKINAAISASFILNELRQVCNDGIIDYFGEFFNYFDLLGNSFVITSAVLLRNTKTENEFYRDEFKNRFLILAIMFIGLRACSSLIIFESYRVQIQLFKQVFIDIGWFMSIVLMLIILMAIVNSVGFQYVEYVKNPENDESVVQYIRENFLGNVGLFYQFMIGENPYEDMELTTTAWIVYIIFTVLVQIVALNLLIAIMSDTYKKVYDTMNANHCRTKVQILLEISGLKCCFRKNSNLKHLHFVRYSSEKLSAHKESDELQQRVKTISNDLYTLQDTVGSMNDHMMDMKDQQNLMNNNIEFIKFKLAQKK